MKTVFEVLDNLKNNCNDLMQRIQDHWVHDKNSNYLKDGALKFPIIAFASKNPYTKEEYPFCIDLLGSYNKMDPNWEQEGIIFLYQENIRQTAAAYVKSFPYQTLDDVVTQLSQIILYHEMIHWMMHWVECPPQPAPFPVPVRYATTDEVNFHECFAQLFTYWYVTGNTDLTHLFQWLELNQPPQYLKYKELLRSEFLDTDKAFCLLYYLRRRKIQSFEETLALVKTQKSEYRNLLQFCEDLQSESVCIDYSRFPRSSDEFFSLGVCVPEPVKLDGTLQFFPPYDQIKNEEYPAAMKLTDLIQLSEGNQDFKENPRH